MWLRRELDSDALNADETREGPARIFGGVSGASAMAVGGNDRLGETVGSPQREHEGEVKQELPWFKARIGRRVYPVFPDDWGFGESQLREATEGLIIADAKVAENFCNWQVNTPFGFTEDAPTPEAIQALRKRLRLTLEGRFDPPLDRECVVTALERAFALAGEPFHKGQPAVSTATSPSSGGHVRTKRYRDGDRSLTIETETVIVNSSVMSDFSGGESIVVEGLPGGHQFNAITNGLFGTYFLVGNDMAALMRLKALIGQAVGALPGSR